MSLVKHGAKIQNIFHIIVENRQKNNFLAFGGIRRYEIIEKFVIWGFKNIEQGSCETSARGGIIESESSESFAQYRNIESESSESFNRGGNMESETCDSSNRFRYWSRKLPRPSRNLESGVGKFRLGFFGQKDGVS